MNSLVTFLERFSSYFQQVETNNKNKQQTEYILIVCKDKTLPTEFLFSDLFVQTKCGLSQTVQYLLLFISGMWTSSVATSDEEKNN